MRCSPRNSWRPKPGENWLLVTSAFHMPRSVGLFRKVGFPVIPWPVDYRTSGKEGIGLFRDNPADALQNTTMAMREWIGLAGYWLSGRIDSLVSRARTSGGSSSASRAAEKNCRRTSTMTSRIVDSTSDGRADEPAEIADREEHAAQARIEMLAAENVHARRAPAPRSRPPANASRSSRSTGTAPIRIEQ